MRILGIILIIAWVLGLIGGISFNNLPKDPFEWAGNLAILSIGIYLVIRGNKNKEK